MSRIKNIWRNLLSFYRNGKLGLYNDLRMRTYYRSYGNKLSECCDSDSGLTKTQKREILHFYSRYGYCDTRIHNFYYQKTGLFSTKIIPDDFFTHYIEKYYNDWNKANVLENKCFFPLLFPNAKHPLLFAQKQNSIWINQKNEIISEESVLDSIHHCDKELFLKFATDSFGGHGVFCYSPSHPRKKFDEFAALIKNHKGDLVIQYGIKQHDALDKLNHNSVNTIRIMSVLRNNKVYTYSPVLRIGVGNSRVDNACSGGIFVGINNDGRLKDCAFNNKGERFLKKHPASGVEYSSVIIPNYDKIIDLVKNNHPCVRWFRLLSWDIAVNEDGEPIIVEVGFKWNDLTLHQLCNGPIFGNDTQEILDEVSG